MKTRIKPKKQKKKTKLMQITGRYFNQARNKAATTPGESDKRLILFFYISDLIGKIKRSAPSGSVGIDGPHTWSAASVCCVKLPGDSLSDRRWPEEGGDGMGGGSSLYKCA